MSRSCYEEDSNRFGSRPHTTGVVCTPPKWKEEEAAGLESDGGEGRSGIS